jgi:hypothetical protein
MERDAPVITNTAIVSELRDDAAMERGPAGEEDEGSS